MTDIPEGKSRSYTNYPKGGISLKKLLMVFVVVVFVFSAIAGFSPVRADAADKITVGAKNFTEQYVVGEMLALLLEENGFKVTTKMGTGSSITREALVSGQTDLYPEYTGTAWLVYFGQDEVLTDPDLLYEKVKKMDLEENNIVWLDRAPLNNTYALSIRKADSDKYGTTISQLAEYINEHPGEIRVGIDQEFYARPDGFPALARKYGMDVEKKSLKIMEIGLTYEAMGRDQLDVAMTFATDGKIPKFDLLVLEDDKQFFPVYNLCPTIRKDVLDKHPEIADIFRPVVEMLDDETMQQLNYEVDVNGKPAKMVAEIFLKEHGFIE